MAEALSKLPSKIYYDQLLNKSDLDKYVDSSYVKQIDKNVENITHAKKIMMMLEKNIDVLYNTEDTSFHQKHCFDLNFWLYVTIHKNLTKPKNLSKLFQALDEYYTEWDKINKNKKLKSDFLCKPDRSLVGIKFLKEVKHLFDYFENFEFVKNEAKKNCDEACNKYYALLKTVIPIYYRWLAICKLKKKNICNKYISIHDDFAPRSILQHVNLVSLAFSALVNKCFKNVMNLVKQSEQLEPRTDVLIRSSKNKPRIVKLIKNRVLAAAEGDIFGIISENNHSYYLLSYIVWFLNTTYSYINENIVLVCAFILGMLFIFGIFYEVRNIAKKKKKKLNALFLKIYCHQQYS
ncbi:PIR protein [Hepatocystis sp. ex Piliocolobus tephrosceles]|nr:PIR protein [Hepatocystis sp. ex Piliocolobus tephrosceles]